MSRRIYVCINRREVGGQPSCGVRGSLPLLAQLRAGVAARVLDVDIRTTVCFGHCDEGPVMRIAGGRFLHHSTPETVDALLAELTAEERS